VITNSNDAPPENKNQGVADGLMPVKIPGAADGSTGRRGRRKGVPSSFGTERHRRRSEMDLL
jgi:hypothetical protein